MSLVALLHLTLALRWLLYVCYLLSVTFYMLLAIWIYLSETCYYLQKLVSFRSCCMSRNFFVVAPFRKLLNMKVKESKRWARISKVYQVTVISWVNLTLIIYQPSQIPLKKLILFIQGVIYVYEDLESKRWDP